MQTSVFLPPRHTPALTLLSVLRLTETDMAAFIFSLIISFWKYCPQSDPSREGLRSQVSECLNYYLLCEKEGKLRQCLPYFISLESFTAMRQYQPVSTALSTGVLSAIFKTNSAKKYWASKYWMYYKLKRERERERKYFLFIVCFYLRIWGNFSISLKLELWRIGERESLSTMNKVTFVTMRLATYFGKLENFIKLN